MSSELPPDSSAENSTSTTAQSAPGQPTEERLVEPSMGPACLVIVVLMLAVGLIVFAFGSFFFFSDQAALAERAIQQQLVPWIETSSLSKGDKQQVLSTLNEVIAQVQNRELTRRQLSRLKNALEDNPVLLWGTVEGVMAQADSAGLSEVEKEASKRVVQRLLRAAADRKLGRNDLVFALEPCAHTRADGQGLEPNENLSAKDIQAFLGRAERFVNGNDVPNEPFEKSVPEVFQGLIQEALSVK